MNKFPPILGVLLLFALSQTSGVLRPMESPLASPSSPTRTGIAERLPAGMERSDWQGILAAHQEWRLGIRPETTQEGQSAWKSFNPGTGLWASFTERGGEVRPESGDWHWGLELTSYGVGTERRSLNHRSPRVEVEGKRIGYDWDGNLEEWYLNETGGLEHGYTIQERPQSREDRSPLELRLKVRGGLREVTIVDDGRGATFGQERGKALLRYTGLKVLDATGEELAARLEIEGGDLRLLVEDDAAHYPLTIDPTITQQEAYLKASDTSSRQLFGSAIALSGNTVVVGAPSDSSNATGINGDPLNNSATDSGAAYVFVWNGTSWSQQAYLKASNTGIFDQFGKTVAISGETVVVGAHSESSSATGVNGQEADNNSFSSGAAYIFVRSGTTWSQQAYLKASNTDADDQFGLSVAISAETVVVGAVQEGSSATGINGSQTGNAATNSGAAYIFKRSGTSWTQEAYLKASNTEAYDFFGSSVSISGETVVVGAFGESSSATGINGNQANNSSFSAGAAYVFVRSGTNWSQQSYLKASNPGSLDYFGESVAISGNSVIVGASGEDSSATGINGSQNNESASDAGAAYIFVRSGTAWSQQAYLKASNSGAGDQFGISVAIADGTAVVGANQEASAATGINGNLTDNGASSAGAAYVFVRNISTWSQQASLKASNTGAGDAFGSTVAVDGERVAIGASLEASNALGVNGDQANNSTGAAGAAYLYRRSGTAWNQEAYLKPSRSGAGGDLFGSTVAISGETVVVGAPREDSSTKGINGDPLSNSSEDSGAAYVFVRSGTSWSQQAYLKASNAKDYNYFGTSVAISGETIVVGADGESSSATGVNGNQADVLAPGSGAAYVFVRSGTAWSQQAYLKASNAGANDFFGSSVSISGNSVIVGATGEDSNATGVNGNQADNSVFSAGAAYVFVRTGSTWSQQAYLKASNTSSVDQFGTTVGISGETVVVGAPREGSNTTGINGNQADNSAVGSGAAYVFARNGTTWSQQAYLKASNTAASDFFGQSVAISGETVVVGAYGEDSNATGINGNQADNTMSFSGAAYVFVRTGTAWSQQAYLKASNTRGFNYFGESVAISGEAIVVGAEIEQSNSTGINGDQGNNSFSSGAAYVFVRNGTTWSQRAFLKASNTGASDFFGNAVAISGETVVVGAYAEDSNATGVNGDQSNNSAGDAGAAYVFTVATNANPTISAMSGVSRPAGSAAATTTIAIVSDAETAAGSLLVTVNGAGTATVNGVTLSNLANMAGTITANLAVACEAPLGTATFPLQVSDGSASANALLVVQVTDNTPPILTYLAAEVATGSGATINPATGPSDNGTITSIIVQSAGSYTGTVSVNSMGGVTLSNAGTVGSHTLLIRATDNCGAVTDALLQVTVTPPGGVGAVTAASASLTPAQGETVGPGNAVTVTQTLTNNTANAITTTFVATLPAGLRAAYCASTIGSCLVGEASGGTVTPQSASQTEPRLISWTGTIPGNGTVTITYQVQVDLQASQGTQYCITSTIGGGAGPTTCLTVTTLPAAPGTLPMAAGLPNQQKPASVLIFNVYTSSANRSLSDTLISLTNTNPANPADVHLFFVDGASGATTDQIVTLRENQTVSFLTSDYDPMVTGYLIAVRIDRNGCPTVANDLIGSSLVMFEGGHRASLPAIGVAGLSLGSPACQPSALTATIAFDGVSYDELPRSLAVPTLPAIESSATPPLLLVSRIGGNLVTGADRLGSLTGWVIDDSLFQVSFTQAVGSSQFRSLLGNNFPRTVPRYTTLIPPGRTGWMKFWASEDEALLGSIIIESSTGLRGGSHLPVLSTTNRARLTIPVIRPMN